MSFFEKGDAGDGAEQKQQVVPVVELGALSLKRSNGARASAVTSEMGVRLSFASGSRAPTNIGAQGDHVTAYGLLVRFVVNRCLMLTPDEAIKTILYIIEHYASNPLNNDDVEEKVGEVDNAVMKMFTQVQGRFADSLMSSEEIQDALKNIQNDTLKKKIELHLIHSNTCVLEKMLEQLAEYYLTVRNKVPLTAFPREGGVDPGDAEGSRVRAALGCLDRFDLAGDYPDEEERRDEILKAIVNLFWYPKVADGELITEAEWKLDSNKSVRDKYTKNTLPRNNDLDVLCQMLERHFLLVFGCYSFIPRTEQEDIRKVVIEEVSRQQGWNLNLAEVEAVTQTVRANINKVQDEETPDSTPEDSRSQSRKGSDSQGSQGSGKGSGESSGPIAMAVDPQTENAESPHGSGHDSGSSYKPSSDEEALAATASERLDRLTRANARAQGISPRYHRLLRVKYAAPQFASSPSPFGMMGS